MKILGSDFDGTISLNGTVSSETMRSIYDWKDAGNMFGIVTGRDIRATQHAIDTNNIPFDFLICNNGAVIFDDQYNEIKSSFIPDNTIKALIKDDDIRKSSYIVLADNDGRYVYDNNYIDGAYPNIFYTGVLTKADLSEPKYFYQIDTKYPSMDAMDVVATSLTEKFGAEVTINPNLDTIDITPKGVTKLTGLQYYVKHAQLNERDVITVGDGLNDIGMIHYFNGYAMEEAVDSIKAGARGVVATVEELIRLNL